MAAEFRDETLGKGAHRRDNPWGMYEFALFRSG